MTKKQWIETGEHKTRFNKLCNSLNYWKNKLRPAVEESSLILTIYNLDRDVKINLFDLVTEVEKLNENIKVQGFADFRNPRYLALYFKNKEERDFIMNNFKMLGNNYVVYLSWALDASKQSTTLRVHWLPLTIDIEKIKQALTKYVQCIEQERAQLKFMSGRDITSGKVNFKVKFNQGVKAENVPHLLIINDMKALITIPGRSPLCLNCECMGHISRDCKRKYCLRCKKMQLSDHTCLEILEKPTYADKVMTEELRVDLDDWKAAVLTDASSVELNKEFILNKISFLEKQVIGAAKQIGTLNPDQKTVKRKLSGEPFVYANDSSSNNNSEENNTDSVYTSQLQAGTNESPCLKYDNKSKKIDVSDTGPYSEITNLELVKQEKKKRKTTTKQKSLKSLSLVRIKLWIRE